MARMTLILNSLDFTADANKYGYSVRYEKRTGPNGGIMMDGTETVDVRARRMVTDWTLNDLPEDHLAALLNVCSDDYIYATTYDPKLEEDRTYLAIPEVSQQTIRLQTPTGVKWFAGPVLTLRER